MKIQLDDTIKYKINDEEYESETVEIVKQELYKEPNGGYKVPDDDVEEVHFKAETVHGDITGVVTARRAGFNAHFEIEDVDIHHENEKLEIVGFNPTIREYEDDVINNYEEDLED